MNNQEMNDMELLLYLYLVLSQDSIFSVLSQHCMQLFMKLLLEIINFKLQRNFCEERWSVNLKLAAEDRWLSWTSKSFKNS